MRLNLKDNAVRIGWILGAVLVGTALDYLVHEASPAFAVPDFYFRHKIIYATLWLFVGLGLFWRVRAPFTKAVLVTAFFAVVLQTRYFLLGYPLWFVLFFMAVHFVVFLAPVYWVFRNDPRLFGIR